MSAIAAMGGAGIGAMMKMTKESKRDSREPYIMHSIDRMLNFAALAIPGATLAVSLYFGKTLFTSAGIEIINPINAQSGQVQFEKWTHQIPVKVLVTHGL